MNQARKRGQAVIRLGMALAWVLLALCPRVFALDPSLAISQYAHTSWKIRDGFTKGRIVSIAQTPDGYLWLGTEFGILRFDGVRAVPWQPPVGQELPSKFIRHLLVTSDGTLWIATQNGLSSWKDGKLTSYPELAGQSTGPLLQDRQGTVWVGRYGPGAVCAIRGGKAECEGVGSLEGGVVAIYEDRKGSLWVSDVTGLWRWKPGPPKRYALPAVTDALTENDGTLLLSTPNGLEQLVDGTIRSYGLPGVPSDIGSTRFFWSSDETLWLGTAQGLLRLRKGRIDKFTTNDGLSGDYVVSMFEDREGNVWVCTLDGLDRFRELAVPTISRNQSLANSLVSSVQATPDGSIWVGTPVGLSRWQLGHVTTYRSRSALVGGTRPDERKNNAGRVTTEITNSGLAGGIFSEGFDDAGRLWVSTKDAVFYFDRDRFVPVRDVPGGIVASIQGDGRGNVWVLHADRGLFKRTSTGVVEKVPWPRRTERYFAALLPDRAEGGLWIGFWDEVGGMAYLKDGQIRASYSSADGLGGGHVNDLRFGAQDAVWAATESGLSRVKEGHIQTLSSKNGLPCDTVFWSMEDNDGSAWLYMPCGLVRVERSELDAWVADSRRKVKPTVFDMTDGVRTRVALGGLTPQVTKSHDGKLWFVGLDGVSTVDPHHLAFNKLPPPVHIEQIIADRKTYDATQGLRLPPLVRDLQIDFTALSLVAPEKVRFRYKLEGYDKDWQEAGNRRQAFYTNLPPRPYRFRVMACNNSGVWNEEGDFLEFSIAPAFYERTSFRALCVLALLVLLFAAYRLRMRQLARQFNRTLEARVSERTRIARDLHDTLLQSYQGLLLRFQSASKLLPDRPVEAKTRLDNAIDQAAAAITEGRDAVQGLRATAFETNDLANAITAMAEELTSAESTPDSPRIEVEVEGTSRNLNPVVRDEAYRIATEALRNAFRHAEARRIVVEIVYEKRQFRLRVRDDGRGIEEAKIRQQPTGHFGLPGMRERAEIVGGTLDVWSAPGSGTHVELSIPTAVAYKGSRRDSAKTNRAAAGTPR